MKRFGTAFVVLLAAIFAGAGCNDYGNTFQNNTGAVISTLSPSTISAGSTDFTITVKGGGFVAKTVVQWNGKTLTSTAVMDPTNTAVLYMTATVPASMVAAPGTSFVNTLNPHSGSQDNGLSNTLAFIVSPTPNPLPIVNAISPTMAAPGSASLPLTITGSSFLPTSDPSGGSLVHWISGGAQHTLNLTAVSANSITATVDSSLLVTEGCAVVSVFNPPATSGTGSGGVPNPSGGGGGTSANAPTFTISTNPSFCPAPANSKTTASSAERVSEETPAVSADGRYVAYTAVENGLAQIFLRDTCLGADSSCQARTTLLSAAADGSDGNQESHAPSISSDGRYVAFSSAATNLVSSTPPGEQIFSRDTCAGAPSDCSPSTQLVSKDETGQLAGAENILPSISSSGRFIAFLSVTYSKDPDAAKQKGTANSGLRQIFVRDTCRGATGACTPATIRISVQHGDTNSSSGSAVRPALSGSASAVGISGANSATPMTSTVRVDDRVFLALTKAKP